MKIAMLTLAFNWKPVVLKLEAKIQVEENFTMKKGYTIKQAKSEAKLEVIVSQL